jgi:2-desacetyl-2-hydroxyethyl bacteriochlorophyllide A dehydrogenase
MSADEPNPVPGVALVASSDGRFTLEPVTVPGPGRQNIVVNIAYSGVSIGSEFGVLRGKMDWGSFPMVTGYMATGTVAMVGNDVAGYTPGDRVFVRHNSGLRLSLSGQPLNGRDGLHCSVASLDPTGDHGAGILPAGVSDDVGSLFTVLSVGMYGVDLAGVSVGDTVVVMGLGTVGLGVVAASAARGARVVAIDARERCCEIASALGAWHAIGAAASDAGDAVRSLVGAAGADFVFEATGQAALIDAAIALVKPFGTFVWQGHYGEGQVSFEFVKAHEKRLRMVFPCDDGLGEVRAALLRNIDSGSLRTDGLITDRLSPEQAPTFFQRVRDNGSGESISPVIRWAQDR